VPAVSSSQRPKVWPLAGCDLTAPRQATTRFHRSGLQHALACLLCRLLTSAGRSGRIAPPSVLNEDTPQISRGKLSYLPCIDAGFIKYAPPVDGGLYGRVPTRPERTTPHIRFVSLARPARAFHASFRPRLTATPLRFPCPSAPRIPGRGTFTPEHGSMHGTHAEAKRRGLPRRLHALVRRPSSIPFL
jgi:hypothetical protein